MLLPLSTAFLGFGMVPVLAFAGALATVFLVYYLARVGGKTPIVSMLLAGFVVSAMLTALMFLIITMSDKLHPRVHFCLHVSHGGHLGVWLGTDSSRGANHHCWHRAGPPVVLFASMPLPLGEEGAAHVGIDVERNKAMFLALGSVLTAAAVSISGLIGFVGLVIPHALRLVLGPDHRILIPGSALAGAAFLVMADTAGAHAAVFG